MSTTTVAQVELVSSLAQDEIPIKLRCAICSRLAVNAFRLPCCDQAICEICQSALPSSCPVCEHTPVAAEDCKPNKALRTTIKVFLRTEEKKRDTLRAKETNIISLEILKEGDPPVVHLVEPHPKEDISADESPAPLASECVGKAATREPQDIIDDSAEIEEAQEVGKDIPQPSIEEVAPGQESTTDASYSSIPTNTAADVEDQSNEPPKSSDDSSAIAQVVPNFGAGFVFDSNITGNLQNMPFVLGGEFNQMQMMIALQNGIGMNSFGGFPMMGMPGMSMDQMNSQHMFMNGGFGTAGMNMGMGLGGFEGGNGTGFNNAWNQQQSWNVGPDNFSHPNAASMGLGDYGANNTGYSQHTTGFNQGNYGHGNQFNDFQSTHHGDPSFRGRGRGRGGFHQGRGVYGYGQNDAHLQQLPSQFGSGQQAHVAFVGENGSIAAGSKADSVTADNVDEFGREIRATMDEEETAKSADNATVKDQVVDVSADSSNQRIDEPRPSEDTADLLKPIQSLETMQNLSFSAPSGPAGHNPMSPVDTNIRNYGYGRGGFAYPQRGRSGNFSVQSTLVKDIPINAPTGPKAMREGLPNTGLSSLRGRGFSIAGRASSRPVTADANSVVPVIKHSSQVKERSKSPSQDRHRGTTRSRSRSYSRSRSRERRRDRQDRNRRSRRHRSLSLSDDDKEQDRRRERRKERRSRRHEDEGDQRDREHDNERNSKGIEVETITRDMDEGHSRSVSPTHSNRRSRRDRDKERCKDKDYKSSSHKHRSGHRSNREDQSRSRDREREREHRHSRRYESRRASPEMKEKVLSSSIVTTNQKAESPLTKSPTTMTSGLEISGASVRRASEVRLPALVPTGPSKERGGTKDTSSRYREDRHRTSHLHDRDAWHSSGWKADREGASESQASKANLVLTQDPHTLEREARNRERLLKEAQRMAMGGGSGARKRSRDDAEDASSSIRKGKKKGRRGVAITEESEEDRLARFEAERESARWG